MTTATPNEHDTTTERVLFLAFELSGGAERSGADRVTAQPGDAV